MRKPETDATSILPWSGGIEWNDDVGELSRLLMS
jgi:hypothetical protein